MMVTRLSRLPPNRDFNMSFSVSRISRWTFSESFKVRSIRSCQSGFFFISYVKDWTLSLQTQDRNNRGGFYPIWSWNVFPHFTPTNGAYQLPAHSKSMSKTFSTSVFITCPNQPHIGFRQLRTWISRAFKGYGAPSIEPPLSGCVLRIVLVRSEEKMIRVHTRRVVASVADQQLSGRTNPNMISEPMPGIVTATPVYAGISGSVLSFCPIPATALRVNLNSGEDEVLVECRFHAVRFENHRPRRTAAVLTHGSNPVLRIDGDDGEFSASAVRPNPETHAISFQA